MKKSEFVTVFVASFLFFSSCASAKHTGVVSLAATHYSLAAVQDTEMTLKCDQEKPPTPCILPDQHKAISAKLAKAFALDEDVAKAIKNSETVSLSTITDLWTIINDVKALFPASPQKALLEKNIVILKEGNK